MLNSDDCSCLLDVTALHL